MTEQNDTQPDLDNDPVWTQVRGLHFDRNGTAINLRDWAEHFEDNEYRILGRDQADEILWVSTIWDGTEVIPTGSKPPLIFETGLFTGEPGNGGNLITRWRTPTEAEAMRMHGLILDFARTHHRSPITAEEISEDD